MIDYHNITILYLDRTMVMSTAALVNPPVLSQGVVIVCDIIHSTPLGACTSTGNYIIINPIKTGGG